MTHQDLIQQLKRLENINPDRAWLANNRELLVAQISNSGAEKLALWRLALINLSSFSRVAVRPASSFAVFVLLLVSGAIFSQRLVAQAQPNESLYIARIISEQVRLGTTLNSANRDKLAMQFAANHAQDISTVLANPDFNTEENREKVEKLNNSFRAEVAVVKRGLSRLSGAAPAASVSVNQADAVGPNNETAEEDVLVMAESQKDSRGLELKMEVVSEMTGAATSGPSIATPTPALEADPNIIAALEDAINDVSDSDPSPEAVSEYDRLINEIQDLFEAKQYSQAAEKLKAINKIIKK